MTEHRRKPPRSGSSTLGRSRHIRALAALALALAAPTAHARPRGSYELVVSGAGDQTQPSIDASTIVFASSAGAGWDVLLYEIGAPPDQLIRAVAATAADEDQPDVKGATVAYRAPDGVHVRDLALSRTVRSPADTPATSRCNAAVAHAGPVVTDVLAAWQCDVPGGSAVALSRFDGPAPIEYDVARPGAPASGGSQRAPAAHGGLVAFIDGTDGDSVWLHDSDPSTRATTRVCAGRATGVSVGDLGSVTYLAVTRADAAHDDDLEIWDATGLVTAIRVAGVQRNPHLAGEWVAFEDLSTGRAQVVLWNWVTGLVFLPHASTSNQTLNDLALVAGTEVRAVFADDGNGDLDIALYRVPLPVVDDGIPTPWPWEPARPAPARCDDPDPTVLATLVLGRARGEHLAGHVHLEATPLPGDPRLPVLVCVDARRVLAAWLALDDEVIVKPWRRQGPAWPGGRDGHDDLVAGGGPGRDCEEPGDDPVPLTTHVEARLLLDAGRHTLAGVIAGRPGAHLVARVLADPGRVQGSPPPPVDPGGAGTLEGGGPHGRGGCSAAGAGGPLGAALALLALALRRRR